MLVFSGIGIPYRTAACVFQSKVHCQVIWHPS